MGHSCGLHSSADLTQQIHFYLTLEINKDIRVEISTGFSSGNRSEMSVSLPVTLAEINLIIERLKKLSVELSNAWKCPECGLIQEINYNNPPCSDCDHLPDYDRLSSGEYKVK